MADPRSRLLKNAGSSERYDSVGDEAEVEFAPRTSQYYEEVEDEDDDDHNDVKNHGASVAKNTASVTNLGTPVPTELSTQSLGR